jgi:hypothetical protein
MLPPLAVGPQRPSIQQEEHTRRPGWLGHSGIKARLTAPPELSRPATPLSLLVPRHPPHALTSGIVRSSVKFVAQPLAGLELGLFRRGDLDLLAGPWIAAFRSRP